VKAKDIMTANAYCVRFDQSLSEAARLMWEHGVGSVPVLDEDGQMIAMVTDRDIAMAAFLNGARLEDITVSTAQSQELVCCRLDDDLGDIEAMMRAHRVHRIPVIGPRFEPRGIISLNDIALACKSGVGGIQPGDVTDTLAAICESASPGAQTVGAAA
jgi:CBS domain-containing protein